MQLHGPKGKILQLIFEGRAERSTAADVNQSGSELKVQQSRIRSAQQQSGIMGIVT